MDQLPPSPPFHLGRPRVADLRLVDIVDRPSGNAPQMVRVLNFKLTLAFFVSL